MYVLQHYHTIDINNLCELLQAFELIKTEQPSVATKWQNHAPVLAAGATSSLTYVVTLGCSSLMADT
jgi:hypothetical protein